MADPQEEDFGLVEKPAGTPRAIPEDILRFALDKSFQLRVLKLFLIAITGTIGLDMAYRYMFGSDIIDMVLRVIVPVFTFVLGVGTQIRSKSD